MRLLCAPQYARVIGLTGSIASGKSHARQFLGELGAVAVDADALGHRAYAKGSRGFRRVVERFGDGIVDIGSGTAVGKGRRRVCGGWEGQRRGVAGEIDRKALGAVVFADKGKLAELSAIVWPEIMELVLQQLHEGRMQGVEGEKEAALRVPTEVDAATGAVLAAEHIPLERVGGKVAVVEAAVLFQAGWENRFDAVWGTVVPRDVALERLQQRNPLLTRDELLQRVDAAVSPETVAQRCTVVVDTSGPKAHTRRLLASHWRALVHALVQARA